MNLTLLVLATICGPQSTKILGQKTWSYGLKFQIQNKLKNYRMVLKLRTNSRDI